MLLAGCSRPVDNGVCATDAECPAEQRCVSGTCTSNGSSWGGNGGGQLGGAGVGGSTAGGGAAGQSGSGSDSGGQGGTSAGAAGTSSAGAGGGGAGSDSGGQGGGSAGAAGTNNAGAGGGSAGAAGTNNAGAGGGGGEPPVVPDVPGQCQDDFWPAMNNRSVTRYDFRQGTSLPACGYAITHTGSGNDGDWDTVEGISTGDGGYFGAMNTTDFMQGAACGACVEATYSGRTVVLTIVDECPISSNALCTGGHIDLSRKAIRQLEPNASLEHLTGVSWRYVECPASGNVKVRLHPNQNNFWQPVIIENGLFPLKSVTLNGMNASRTGNDVGGNAWIAAELFPPFTVRATDVTDGTVTFDFAGGTELQDTGKQFTCQ